GVRGKDGAVHLLLHDYPLDDPAVPLRPADGAGVEGADPAGAGERGGGAGGEAVPHGVRSVGVAAGVAADPHRRRGASAVLPQGAGAAGVLLPRPRTLADSPRGGRGRWLGCYGGGWVQSRLPTPPPPNQPNTAP